tara:strand:+ start:257 stop:1000 length:744 start_codon:yes stop_codon:yes gene_type:complete
MKITKPIVFVDVDTTGLSHTKDRIVKLNLSKLTLDNEVIDGSRLLNPGIPISSEATEINGITLDMVAKEPRFENIVDALHSFMEGCDIAGYNVKKFDLPILVEHFHRAGKPLNLSDINIIDLRDLFMIKEPRTLEGAYNHYVPDSDQPESDSKAMVKIYSAQINKYKDLPESLDELSMLLADKNDIDLAGKIKKNNVGKPTLSFGKYSDKTLEYVENNDPSYLSWMLDSDYFTEDTKEAIRTNTSVG